MLPSKNIYRTVIVLVGLMMAATAVPSAAVTVDNVSLKKQGEFTELTIYASGPLDFNHQFVEPGAGKPYRIVVDLDDAIHKLPHYNFNDLPSETITAIRTSQFSARPEIVRVVLDLNGRVTYKVRREKNGVTLIVATPNDPEFPFWCAQPMSEAEKIQLALGVASTPTSAKSVPEKSVEPVLVSNSVSNQTGNTPKISLPTESPDEKRSEPTDKIDGAPTPQHERSKLATAILNNLPEPELEPLSPGKASDAAVQGQDRGAEPAKSKSAGTDPLTEQSSATNLADFPMPPFLVSDDDSKASQDGENLRTAPQPKITSDKKGKVPAKAADDSAPLPGDTEPTMDRTLDSSSKQGEPGIRKTSPSKKEDASDEDTYRQNPDRPTKTSGTLADRFPKRKVIEYQSWGRRDPFAQLVDKSVSGHEPGEIPNVETLRLVGVLRSLKGSSALLEDYDGYGYILKDGDPVLNGYVVQIGDDKIIFQIKEYGWSRTVALRLETD